MTQQQSKKVLPAQHQDKQPGVESLMNPKPVFEDSSYKGSGKTTREKLRLLLAEIAGLEKAAAIAFAKEGAHVAIAYLDEHEDANETKRLVERHGVKCLLLAGDLGQEEHANYVVEETVKQLGGLHIVVNNIAQQYPQQRLEDITAEQWERTFRINIFSYFFYVTKAALSHLKEGDCIINTASVVAYEGNEQLLDYAATKGAIVAFTRSLAKSLVKKAVFASMVWHLVRFGHRLFLQHLTVNRSRNSAPMCQWGVPDSRGNWQLHMSIWRLMILRMLQDKCSMSTAVLQSTDERECPPRFL
ncbi:hypothetical protein GCM10020331_082060 [Ectobacillus funiculus]